MTLHYSGNTTIGQYTSHSITCMCTAPYLHVGAENHGIGAHYYMYVSHCGGVKSTEHNQVVFCHDIYFESLELGVNQRIVSFLVSVMRTFSICDGNRAKVFSDAVNVISQLIAKL